jgi:hypothetical protein
MMRYRSLVPPAVLILVVSAGAAVSIHTARERQRQRQALEDSLRLEAAQAVPTPEVLEQVRSATKTFMAERHPELNVEGETFTPLTPNLLLVGVAVQDPLHGNRYVARLTAERLRDGDWGEDGEPGGEPRLLWLVDYASQDKLRELADRHGFAPEVDRVRDLGRGRGMSWGQRDWLDDYLLWSYVYQRPPAYTAEPGGGFTALPAGYRFQDPEHPITPADAAWVQAASAPSGGRSRVYLGGWAWRPPWAGNVFARSGTAYGAGLHGSISGHVSMGVSRGGFGAAGHAAGVGG